MRTVRLTPLLVRARDAGLSLRAEDGCIVATPKALLAPELRCELARHKAELLAVLAWDEDAAYDLARKALAYLNESHQRAGAPDFSLEPLDEPERRINAACEERDMFAYRIATREFVQAGLRGIERAKRARGEADEFLAAPGETQSDALRADRDRRASDPGFRSRRRERGVREPAGAGFATGD